MKKYLYQDLFELEEVHWWHIAKRKICLALIKKYVKTRSNFKVLDIGCGTGKNLEEFCKFGKAFGIDTSIDAIRFCREKRGLKNVTLASAQKTGFSYDSFDVVCILDVLEHTDDKKTLKEIHRILKPGGLLLITVPAFNFLWSRWDEVLHHRRRYTRDSLGRILYLSNFKVIKISYMYFFLIIPLVIIRFIKSIMFKKHYPSDFKISSNFLNKLMLAVTALESKLIFNCSVPVGTSLLCICKNNEA